MQNNLYDVLIIGAGPAGLTASIYASRYKLNNLVIGKMIGGTITYAHKVENFPGFKEISGVELGQKMAEQARAFGAEILLEGAARVEIGAERVGPAKSHVSARRFKIVTEADREFETETLIVATGTERRKLGVPGEAEYLGKGVSYCTTCDAPFFKGKTVVLVGGSNAACSGALHLADFAQKIYLIYRKSQLRAEPVWVEEVKANPKIEVIYETNIVKILGGPAYAEASAGKQGRVAAVELDKHYNGEEVLKVDGVFIEIGGIPSGELLRPLGVEFTEDGYVRVSEKMETNIPGLFAAGDVTDKGQILSQAITACAQGAIAANSAFEYLKSNK